MLPQQVKALLKPGMKLEETHIDYVLIGPRYAYKIKKSVKFPFIDYSTPALRQHFCQEELRLNRRTAPGVYLGIEKGAVKMRALPAEKRLDRLLAENMVTRSMIRTLAREIWDFHRKAITSPKIRACGHPSHMHKVYAIDLKDMENYAGKTLTQKFKKHTYGFLSRHTDWFEQRIKEHKIRDLHGDLHSENIFYLKQPVIIDCIEFNTNFRYIDTAAELGFLLMDLEYRGYPDMAQTLHFRCHASSMALVQTALSAAARSTARDLIARQPPLHYQ